MTKVSFIVNKTPPPPVPSTTPKFYVSGYNQHGTIINHEGENRYSFCNSLMEDEWQTFNGGDDWIIGIKTNGELWGWGGNSNGELGQGGASTVYFPTQLLPGTFLEVFAGSAHTVVLKSDGTVWSTGNNYRGQLGTGDRVDREVFTQTATDVAHIACGEQHSMLIKTDGRVFGTGYNIYGAIGCNDNDQKQIWTEALQSDHLTSLNATAVSCGEFHTYITVDGNIMASGRNISGELGLGHNSAREIFTPIVGGITGSHFLRKYKSYVITDNGDLYCCGENSEGALGLGDNTDRNSLTLLTSNCLAVLPMFSCVLVAKTDGTLWGSGTQTRGELGFGNTSARNTLTANGESGVVNLYGLQASAIFRKDPYFESDTPAISGNIHNGILPSARKDQFCAIPIYSESITIDSHGLYFTFRGTAFHFITDDGKMYGFGDNTYYELGLGYNSNVSTRVQIGNDTDWATVYNCYLCTFAIKTDGTLWVVGNNDGNFGTGDTSNRNNWTQIGSDTDWVQVSGGDSRHTLALKTNGSVWGTGENGSGQLGIGSTSDKTVFTATNATSGVASVQVGTNFSGILYDNGDLYMTGNGGQGQFGIGSQTSTSFIPVLTNVSKFALGSNYSLVVKTDGTLWSTGYNSHGQLGLGNKTQKFVWTQVGSDTDWEDVTSADDSSMALKSDGTLWGAGGNDYGLLGVGDESERTSFTKEINDLRWRMIGASQYNAIALTK